MAVLRLSRTLESVAPGRASRAGRQETQMYNALNEQVMFEQMERQRERLRMRRATEPKVRRWLRRAA